VQESACFGTCTRNRRETERHSTAIFFSGSFLLILTWVCLFNLPHKQLLQHVTFAWIYLRQFCSVWVPKKNSARKILLTLGLFRLSFRSSVHSGDVMRDFESLSFRSIVAVNLRLETRVWRMEGRNREIEEERSRRIDEESWFLTYNPQSFFSLNNPKRVLKYCFQIDRDFFLLHASCKHLCMLHLHCMPFRGMSYLQVVSLRYYMCLSLCGVLNYMTFSSCCPPVQFWTRSTEFLHHPSGLDLFFGSHVPECGTYSYVTFQGSV